MALFGKNKENKPKSDYDKMLVEQLDQLEASKLKPVCWNENSKIYCQANELNGFHLVTVLVTGNLKINTADGVWLTLMSEKDAFELRSDSEIVKGDYSDAANVGVTSFDVDLTDELIQFVATNELTGVKIETKSGQFIKKKLSFEYGEVDAEEFKTRIDYFVGEEE